MLKPEKEQGLDIEDFAAFLHPEHFPRMQEIFVQEFLEDIDSNQGLLRKKIRFDLEFLRWKNFNGRIYK